MRRGMAVAVWAAVGTSGLAYGQEAAPPPPDPRPFWGGRFEVPSNFPASKVEDAGTRYEVDGDRQFGASFGLLGGVRWRRWTVEGYGGLLLRSHDAPTPAADENYAVIGAALSAGVAFWPIPQISVGVKGVADLGSGHPDPNDDNGPVVYDDVDGGFYRAGGFGAETRFALCGIGCRMRFGLGLSVSKVWFRGVATYGPDGTEYEASGSGVIIGVFADVVSP